MANNRHLRNGWGEIDAITGSRGGLNCDQANLDASFSNGLFDALFNRAALRWFTILGN